jgi:hypothetical protein
MAILQANIFVKLFSSDGTIKVFNSIYDISEAEKKRMFLNLKLAGTECDYPLPQYRGRQV